MDALDNLKNAIVKQAAEDYAAAFMGNRVDGKEPEDMISECEKFFRSDWYTALTDDAIDGEWLMREIKIRELEKTAEIYEMLVSVCNRVTFKANITFPVKKGEEKRKPMNYLFPPMLADGLMDMARIQLESLKAQIKELKPEEEAE